MADNENNKDNNDPGKKPEQNADKRTGATIAGVTGTAAAGAAAGYAITRHPAGAVAGGIAGAIAGAFGIGSLFNDLSEGETEGNDATAATKPRAQKGPAASQGSRKGDPWHGRQRNNKGDNGPGPSQ